MRKLSKAQMTRFDALKERFEEQEKVVDDLIGKLQAEVASYNEIVGEFNELREEVNGDQEDYYDNRSEKWQEGDAGSDYMSWKDQWSTELDPVDEPDYETPSYSGDIDDNYPVELQ